MWVGACRPLRQHLLAGVLPVLPRKSWGGGKRAPQAALHRPSAQQWDHLLFLVRKHFPVHHSISPFGLKPCASASLEDEVLTSCFCCSLHCYVWRSLQG